MPADPAADSGGVEPAAVIETAVLVLTRGRVVFGLGMTQQHQTAHGHNLDSLWPELIYKLMPGTR